jgi:hypothetical protein
MEQHCDLRNVHKSAFGDFVDFDLHVVDSWLRFRISGGALAALSGPARLSALKAFELYTECIKEIATDLSAKKAGNGRLAIISSDFSGTPKCR